ncbi:hypothetical protein [Streptomyces similanensis]|uniref:HK97 gp10 family phage protein n=1 Tax=Streptomyces similanensis TaxID=1274988 RepID=A0ABP9KG25_9ACTN
MSPVRITWHGPAVETALRAAAARGVRLGTEHLLEVSNQRVPIEEGTLERSGVATVDEGSLTGAVSYDTPYAVRQHEDMSLRHDAGREAKWLEKAARSEADTVGRIIDAQVRRALR